MDKIKMPVECVVEFDIYGNPKPIRIKFGDSDGRYALDIKKVLEKDTKNSLNNEAKVHNFKCQSIIEGMVIHYKLQYETEDNTWHMFVEK